MAEVSRPVSCMVIQKSYLITYFARTSFVLKPMSYLFIHHRLNIAVKSGQAFPWDECCSSMSDSPYHPLQVLPVGRWPMNVWAYLRCSDGSDAMISILKSYHDAPKSVFLHQSCFLDVEQWISICAIGSYEIIGDLCTWFCFVNRSTSDENLSARPTDHPNGSRWSPEPEWTGCCKNAAIG